MLRGVFCKLLLAAVVIFSLLAFSGTVLAQGRSEEAFERVKEVQERHTVKLMAKKGVVGTAVGLNDKGEHDVIILLEKDNVPGIPQELEGVPVRPVVSGKIYAYVDRTARFPRPVPIGVSTGHPAITAGTIGCRVYDDENDNGIRDDEEPVFALSNNHVYADENLAEIGDPVIQPGTYDRGLSPADDIGTLAAYEEIKFDGSPNIIDAAIASTTTALVDNATPSDGYGTPKSTTVTPGFLQSVQKYGRTTGLTSGMVFGANSAVNVEYSSGSVAYFENQIMIYGNFSAGGDSGSLVVTDPGKEPVGLLFAGGGGLTFANPIGPVLSRFDVKIDSSEGPVNNPPVADFSGSPTSGQVPLTVDFTDLSTENPTSWSWDFGNGGTSTAQNPSYTYNTAGTYSVTLTAINEYGSDVEMKAAYINVTESDPLIADFEGSPTIGDAPLTVNFTDLSSGNPLSWGWEFGNGDASLQQNPVYTYNEPGEYDVTLIVSSGFEIDMVTKVDYIIVTGQAGNPPTAEFSANTTSGEAPLEVQFTDLSADNPTSWSWDFGDDVGTSTAQNPTYTYDTPGVYTVSLTATNSYGSNTVTKVDYITVSQPSVEIMLTALGDKVRGRKTTYLEWSGATSAKVVIYRDGELIVTTANDGSYTDTTDSRGGGSFTYQVCEIGGSPCSNVVTVYY